jgi:phage/plasmid-associated DNA primase
MEGFSHDLSLQCSFHQSPNSTAWTTSWCKLAQRVETEEFKSSLLNWLLAGAKRYYAAQQASLPFPRPNAVLNSMLEYRLEEDLFATFFNELFERTLNSRVRSNELYNDYRTWADENNHPPVSSNEFGRKMTKLGLERDRNRHNYLNIQRKTRQQPPTTDADGNSLVAFLRK